MAHTSGWPSGTVNDDPSTAARSCGSSRRQHHRVHGGHADVAAPAGGDGGVDPVHRALVVGQRQRDAEHVDGGRGDGRRGHRRALLRAAAASPARSGRARTIRAMPRSSATPAAWRSPLRAVAGRLGSRARRRRRATASSSSASSRRWAPPRASTASRRAPLVGEARTPAAELAVCIAPAGRPRRGRGRRARRHSQSAEEAAAVTRDSLQAQTVRPGAVMETTPAVALRESARRTRAPAARRRPPGPDRARAPGPGPDAGSGGGAAHLRPRPLRRARRAPQPVARPRPLARRAAGGGAGRPAGRRRPARPRWTAAAAPGPGWELELSLALAGPDGAGHAHVPAAAAAPAAGGRPDDEVLAAVAERALHARGEVNAGAVPLGSGLRRVRRPLVGEPTVEVVVCFRDRPDLLERCARSLLERTEYERLSLCLVDNASSDPAPSGCWRGWPRDPRVRVVVDPSPFNFAALNNRALRALGGRRRRVPQQRHRGPATADWLERPARGGPARGGRRGGAAARRIPTGSVQHAGAALGLHGYAGHPFAGLRPTSARRSAPRPTARATGWP